MRLNLIRVNKNYKTFNEIVYANRNITLDLKAGDMAWISGATGSGKTTLINLISGIDIQDSGDVVFDSISLNSMGDRQRTLFRRYNMGLIFQHFELIASLTGFENILLPLRFSNKSHEQAKDMVTRLVKLFDLENFVNRKPKHMSGGQRQRIGIARAFVYEPKLILGDEITSHLDHKTATFIYSVVKHYIEKMGSIGIFISHDSNLEKFANKFYRIEDGILSLRSKHA
ncbi:MULTISPECIES: ABC transporter ATP-binding protein [unclassified Borrelia]|uniref:ABC transporter ATP-binding protein n=1 Tax=unclassified Borrelia TaxID=2649934 RepID=UPI001E5F230D|nr:MULTISPECIES: ABC transporter ATP-binding protein [unclassified Borrelia]UGQ16582.1 ABC transporter ATP-binding protein [Borrelia sp. RT5S]UGQ17748.1 ABC transporter ATP-binding protein [Borrelia sp. RT1S]